MLQSQPRLTLLCILFIIYQLNTSDGTNSLKILKLKEKNLQNILPLYSDRIGESPKHRYMIVIYNSTARNKPENQNEIYRNHNFRRLHMGLYLEESDLLILQRKRREEAKKKAEQLWQAQHRMRLDYINQTLTNRFRPTIFLYNEMKRIVRDREVFDPLRRMILHLEREGNEALKAAVLKCYQKFRPANEIDGLEIFDTNNLVDNYLRDPYNDNVH